MGLKLDSRRFPLVVTLWDGNATEEELEAFFAQLSELLKRGRAMVLIYDARGTDVPSSSLRKRQSAWIGTLGDAERELLIGTVWVLLSPVLRGVLNFLALFRKKNPLRATETLEKAVDWGVVRLRDAGLEAGRLGSADGPRS